MHKYLLESKNSESTLSSISKSLEVQVWNPGHYPYAAFILTIPTSDLIQTFQKRTCDQRDHMPSRHSRGVQGFSMWAFGERTV